MPTGSYGNEEELAGLLGAYFACIGVFVILMIAFYVFVFWKILDKAGFNPWLSLLNLLGGIGTFILLAILAFSEWPAMKPGAGRYAPAGPQPPGGYYPAPPPYREAGPPPPPPDYGQAAPTPPSAEPPEPPAPPA